MSTQGDRQQEADFTRPRWHHLHWWFIGVLSILFVLQLAYQLFFANHSFADVEQMKKLQELSLDRPSPEAKSSGNDWPQWRGPNRDGISMETGLLTAWPEDGPRRLWQQPLGIGYSSLAIAGGRVFTLMQGDQEAVVCWDAETGKELWRFRYPARHDQDYPGTRSTPTVDGNHVYTVGRTGILHCLLTHPSSPDGEVVWRKDLLAEFGATNIKWGASFSALIEGNLIYTNPGGKNGNSLAAFDKRTGALVWKNLDDQAGYSSPIAATIAGKRQIIFFTGDGLVGVSPSDGALYWRFDWQTSYGCNIATPIVVQDYIFISSGYNRGCAVVHIESLPDGTLEARRVYENNRMCNHHSSCVFYKDHLYGFNENRLTCLEFRTGRVKWRANSFRKGSLLIADGYLIILDERGKLGLAEATAEGYREQAACQISSRTCWTVPALANGRLYIRDEEKVMCLDLRK